MIFSINPLTVTYSVKGIKMLLGRDNMIKSVIEYRLDT